MRVGLALAALGGLWAAGGFTGCVAGCSKATGKALEQTDGSTPSTPGAPTDVPLTGPLSSARIFFSGHSLLDNPMPDFVQSIAQGLGVDVNWNQQNIGGSPIRVRTWGNGSWEGYRQGKNRSGTNLDVIQELRSPKTLGAGERYDTLLITERHDILDTIRWEDTAGYLRHFHDRLIEGNSQGRSFLYHTWLDIDKASPSAWISHEKSALLAWECVASKVNLTLEAAGRSDRVVPLPGGAALVDLVERVLANQVRGISGTTTQKLNVLFSDNVHLTPLGAYYLAAVHFASIYRRSPVGAPGPSGATAETVEDLQTIAWAFVSTYYAQPSPGVHTMEHCRQKISSDVCPTYWGLKGQPQNVSTCQAFFTSTSASSGNPFLWPQAGYQPLPAP